MIEECRRVELEYVRWGEELKVKNRALEKWEAELNGWSRRLKEWGEEVDKKLKDSEAEHATELKVGKFIVFNVYD